MIEYDETIIPEKLREAAATANEEGRLFFRCTDHDGRPCNGGIAEPLPLGEWSARISNPKICYRGWHLTSDPIIWRGSRLWLVEGEDLAASDVYRIPYSEKTCWGRIRPLAEVTTHSIKRIRAAAMRPNLSRADLRGADLGYANLQATDLGYANLRGADLQYAYLGGADLWRANLRGANLYHADLRGADLRQTNLRGADLHHADLRGADLYHADLRGAELGFADLEGTNLEGAVRD